MVSSISISDCSCSNRDSTILHKGQKGSNHHRDVLHGDHGDYHSCDGDDDGRSVYQRDDGDDPLHRPPGAVGEHSRQVEVPNKVAGLGEVDIDIRCYSLRSLF